MNKVLNLYAGIGGNRKLWTNCQVTAVEIDQSIADEYSRLYPDDEVIVGDAFEYLRKNYKKFDFIWASPPCQTHSRMNTLGVLGGDAEPYYPDMSLYQLIIFLKHFYRGAYVVENVIPFYKPLIAPDCRIERHYYWSSVFILYSENLSSKERNIRDVTVKGERLTFSLKNNTEIKNKRQVLRNLVDPEIGKAFYKAALGSC